MELDGTIVEANRLSWEGCGYTREQIVGKRFWEGPWWASSPALGQQIKAASAQAIAGATFRGETPYFVADGSERIADITIVPIKDEAGQVLFLAPTGIDITDRKRAEADRQKFVTLVENSSDFIGMCDLQGVPFFVNRAGLEMVGLDDLEQARRMPVADFFFPEDQPRIMDEFFPSVLAQGHGEIEVRFRHFKTGEARWMAYKVLTLPDAAGRPMAFATVSQDVTERRRLADDLAEAEPTAARPSSSPCWRTSCETRSPRSATPCAPCASDTAMRRWRARRWGCSNVRWASWRAWSTISST